MEKDLNSYFFVYDFRIILQLTIFTSLLFAFCPIETKSQSSKYFDLGINEFESKQFNNSSKQFDNALMYFSKSIEQGEKVAESYYYRAWCRIYQLKYVRTSVRNRLRLIDLIKKDLQAAIDISDIYQIEIVLDIVKLFKESSFSFMISDDYSDDETLKRYQHLPPLKHDLRYRTSNAYSKFFIPGSYRLNKSLIEFYLSKRPDDPEAYYYKAKIAESSLLADDYNTHTAFESYKKAITLDPSFEQAYESRADLVVYLSTEIDEKVGYTVKNGQKDNLLIAKEDYDMLLILNPNHPTAFRKRAMIKILINEVQSGCEDLNDILKVPFRASKNKKRCP